MIMNNYINNYIPMQFKCLYLWRGSYRMLLYHGTDDMSAQNILANGINFSLCDRFTDNGRGFYLSVNQQFALRRADVMTKSPRKPVVLEMYYNEKLANKNLNILHFDTMSEEWKFFVIFNRVGIEYYEIMNDFFPKKRHNLKATYDIVIDIPADAKISDRTYHIEKELKKFLATGDREKCRQNILNLIRSVTIGEGSAQARQISFHTDRALDYLKFPNN